MTHLYGMPRTTADVDVIAVAPAKEAGEVMATGQRGGELARRYGVYLDRVGVAAVPENYAARITEMYPGAYLHLRLMALDPYDLALSKLERNQPKDRSDVRYLARTIPLDPMILADRYRIELRWQLGVPQREDLTLRLWLEMIEEDRGGPGAGGGDEAIR